MDEEEEDLFHRATSINSVDVYRIWEQKCDECLDFLRETCLRNTLRQRFKHVGSGHVESQKRGVSWLEIETAFNNSVLTGVVLNSSYIEPRQFLDDAKDTVLDRIRYPSNVPNYTAEIHVDSAELWHIYLNEKPAVNKYYLLNTLTYEIGHALGLSHSSREDSIMFAFAGTSNNSNKIVKLNLEVILAIQQLYGIKNYAIFNNNDVAQIDECSMSVRLYQSLRAVFPGIPSAPTLAFRYMDGNIYFAKKQQFYKFNEFTRSVTEADKFNINVLNVECSRDELLRQMQNILGRLIRSSDTYSQNTT
ncbi:Putative matrix metalloproteinase [Trachymyrmex septentrionalis]|uniref:Putative matrix metalloproteinase n=1 Tax=Trachymyrmex septentrionalis TaxID=34720 RepID=A0A151JSX4_9HYME|nr:Putative matrix metalloproteinase [Trachymyrmex septentrionalis]